MGRSDGVCGSGLCGEEGKGALVAPIVVWECTQAHIEVSETFVDRFVERRSGVIVFEERGRIERKNIVAFSIYKGTK